jgi:GNAT superfamily N-acetyltransferase
MQPPEFTINDDRAQTDIAFVHYELAHSYWAEQIPKDIVSKAVENSLCINVFSEGKQVAFARVVTDKCTYAYLCDVIVTESARGKGVGKSMMKFIMEHPDLQGLRRFTLATRDAHGLYEQFGFEVTKNPQNMMEIVRRDIYKQKP